MDDWGDGEVGGWEVEKLGSCGKSPSVEELEKALRSSDCQPSGRSGMVGERGRWGIIAITRTAAGTGDMAHRILGGVVAWDRHCWV